jgi:hypothetical protein
VAGIAVGKLILQGIVFERKKLRAAKALPLQHRRGISALPLHAQRRLSRT